jgi:hypothetical protein
MPVYNCDIFKNSGQKWPVLICGKLPQPNFTGVVSGKLPYRYWEKMMQKQRTQFFAWGDYTERWMPRFCAENPAEQTIRAFFRQGRG